MKKVIRSLFILSALTLFSANAFAQAGSAINFDGVDDYITTPTGVFNYSNGVTFEAWVYLNSLADADGAYLITNDQFPEVLVNLYYDGASSRFRWETGVFPATLGQSFSTTPLSANTWYHVDGTMDAAGNSRLYVNGNLQGSHVASVPTHPGPVSSLIGGNPGVPPRTLNGTLDEIRIWNYPRTQAQIQATMNESIQTPTAGLAVAYSFNNVVGTSVPDNSGNGITGTIVNGAVVSASTAPIVTLATIPTVSEWGVIILSLLLLSAGMAIVRRKRVAAVG